MAMSDQEIRERITKRLPGDAGEEIVKCLLDIRDSLADGSSDTDAKFAAVESWADGLATKLNADAGVTDANYPGLTLPA